MIWEKKLCDFLAFIKHYKYFKSSYKQLFNACSLHARDFKETHKMSMHLYDKLHYYFDTLKYWNKKKHNNNKNSSKLIIFTDFIFFLYCRTAEFL